MSEEIKIDVSGSMRRAADDFLDQVNQGLGVITARHQAACGEADEQMRTLRAQQAVSRLDIMKLEERNAELRRENSELRKGNAELKAERSSLEAAMEEAKTLLNAQLDVEKENETNAKTRINKISKLVGRSAS